MKIDFIKTKSFCALKVYAEKLKDNSQNERNYLQITYPKRDICNILGGGPSYITTKSTKPPHLKVCKRFEVFQKKVDKWSVRRY